MLAGARLVNAGCGVVVAVASARHLGPVGRGDIVFIVTVAMIATEVVSLGTNVSGRIRILQGAGDRIEDYLGLTVCLAFLQAAGVGAVLAFVGAPVLGLGVAEVVVGVVLSVAMFLSHMLFDAAFALRRTLEVGLRDLLIGVIPLLAVVPLVAMGSLDVVAVLAATAVGYFVGAGYLWRVVSTGSVRFDRSRWLVLVRSGLPVMLGALGQSLAFRADRLVLGIISASAVLGVYSVASTAAEVPRLLLLPIAQLLTNRVASGELPRGGVTPLVGRIMAGYVFVLFMMSAVGPSLVTAAAGGGFSGVGGLMPILVLGEAMLGVHFLCVAVLAGLGKLDALPIPAGVGAVLVVIGSIVAVPRFGPEGASWVRAGGFGAMAVTAVMILAAELAADR